MLEHVYGYFLLSTPRLNISIVKCANENYVVTLGFQIFGLVIVNLTDFTYLDKATYKMSLAVDINLCNNILRFTYMSQLTKIYKNIHLMSVGHIPSICRLYLSDQDTVVRETAQFS